MKQRSKNMYIVNEPVSAIYQLNNRRVASFMHSQESLPLCGHGPRRDKLRI